MIVSSSFCDTACFGITAAVHNKGVWNRYENGTLQTQ
jgi:hypothetical protein